MITNVSKPTTVLKNTGISFRSAWDDSIVTWDSAVVSWNQGDSNLTNTTRQSSSITNQAKP
jgi:hypothetical protein